MQENINFVLWCLVAAVVIAFGIALVPFILPLCGIALVIGLLVGIAILAQKYPIHMLLVSGITFYMWQFIWSLS